MLITVENMLRAIAATWLLLLPPPPYASIGLRHSSWIFFSSLHLKTMPIFCQIWPEFCEEYNNNNKDGYEDDNKKSKQQNPFFSWLLPLFPASFVTRPITLFLSSYQSVPFSLFLSLYVCISYLSLSLCPCYQSAPFHLMNLFSLTLSVYLLFCFISLDISIPLSLSDSPISFSLEPSFCLSLCLLSSFSLKGFTCVCLFLPSCSLSDALELFLSFYVRLSKLISVQGCPFLLLWSVYFPLFLSLSTLIAFYFFISFSPFDGGRPRCKNCYALHIVISRIYLSEKRIESKLSIVPRAY